MASEPSEVQPKRAQELPPIGATALGQVLYSSLDSMSRLNLAYLNMLCAIGLPGAGKVDVHAAMKTLKEWVDIVRDETEGRMREFRNNRPKYRNCEAYFRTLVMISVLQTKLGVTYDLKCLEKEILAPDQAFIHGLLAGVPGTCSNMPVLYATVGRMLHYPIYLCLAKRHTFCRWQSSDGSVRFNIEGTGKGLNVFEDNEYKKWPFPLTDAEVSSGHFLKNLDPIEEMGHFMVIRGQIFLYHEYVLDAIAAFAHANRLMPTNPRPLYWLCNAVNQQIRRSQAGLWPGNFAASQYWGFPGSDLVEYVLKDDYPRIGPYVRENEKWRKLKGDHA